MQLLNNAPTCPILFYCYCTFYCEILLIVFFLSIVKFFNGERDVNFLFFFVSSEDVADSLEE